MSLRGRDLPGAVPLFPISGAILLPRASVPLHVFEPRYLQMVEDVLKTPDRLIGVIQPMGDGLARIGCGGRIVGFAETDDGRLNITLRAMSRFVLTGVEEGFAPYLRGRVDWSPFTADRAGTPQSDPGLNRELFLSRLSRYMESRELATDWDAAREAEDEMLVNSLSMLLPFHDEEKQALLEAETLRQRRELLDGLLEYALHGGDEDEETVH